MLLFWNAVEPASTWDPSPCWVRHLPPVQVFWREVKVCYVWLQANHFFIESMEGKKKIKCWSSVWGFWGAAWWAVVRTQVGLGKGSMKMCWERPPWWVPHGWDYSQSPWWEIVQIPEPELMETGENNSILSCGLLSMLRPCVFSSRASAVLSHSLARGIASSSTSCNNSWFKMYSSIKKKRGGGAIKKSLTMWGSAHHLNIK